MRLRLWIGFALSAVIVGLALARIDSRELVSSLRTASPGWMFLGILSLLSTQWIRSWRWYYLMEAVQPCRFSNLLSATCLGAMTDMLVPARTGDLVRVYVLSRREDVGKVTTLATVLVERVLDLLTVLVMSVPLLVVLDLPATSPTAASRLRLAVLVASSLTLAAIVGLLVLRARRRQVSRFLEYRGGRLGDHVGSFLAGLQTVREGRHVLAVVSTSFLLWSTFALSNALLMRAFSLSLPWWTGCVLLLFQALGVTLPSSPGFIGTYHAAVLAGLSLFGVTGELALGVAVAMHAAFFFPFIALGLCFAWRENLSFGALYRIGHEDASSR